VCLGFPGFEKCYVRDASFTNNSSTSSPSLAKRARTSTPAIVREHRPESDSEEEEDSVVSLRPTPVRRRRQQSLATPPPALPPPRADPIVLARDEEYAKAIDRVFKEALQRVFMIDRLPVLEAQTAGSRESSAPALVQCVC